MLTTSSAAAILVCDVPLPLQLGGWAVLGAVFYRQWRHVSQSRILSHHGGQQDTVNHWTFETANQKALHGSLQNAGYRSAGLLILVLKDQHSRRISRIPVWRDSLSDRHFSYLNLQLMFNSQYRQP